MGIRIEIDTNSGVIREEWDAIIAFATEMKKFGRGDRTIGGDAPAPNAEKTLGEMVQAAAIKRLETELLEERGRAPLPHSPGQGVTLEKLQTPLHPADNPAAGTDPELASFGVPNAPGGTAMVASPAAVPAVGAVPSLPPATSPAPPAPATAAALPASGVPLDSRGLPWDHRIHASTKTQNADATWRNKRGVDETLLAQVEAELRAVMKIPSVPSPHHASPLAGMPPPPPTDAGPITFLKLMPKVTGAIKSGQTTQEHVNAVLKQFGFPHLPAVNTRPDLLQAVHDGIFGGGA